ncbi:hypothetical protein GOODEAATRI_002149 [Goodea atripinnis]|uniref:PH domain-containing protein n=1 Tax=Goodea atripinnis TaxID=208336 RepID=A0ABV0MY06_9TELE
MDLTVVKEAGKTVRASKGASNTARAFSPSFSASSWGLSGHVGVRVLMHRDMITCRFYRSLPRSWLKKYWGQFGKDSNKSSYSPLRWSSSPFSLSSPRLSTCSSNIQSYFLRSPVSRLSFPALKDRDREKDQAGTAASQAADGHRGFPSVPGMTISSFGPSTHLSASFNSSFGTSLRHHSSSGSLPGDMDETDALRSKRCNDDAISLAPSIAESIIVEDSHYAAVRADLESDAQDLEADSWSLARAAARKPRLAQREELHYQQGGRHLNRSGEIGERMKDCYGDFCSHHTEAVSFYKEMLQNNRRFQNLIRGTEEHEDLTRALSLIKDTIKEVDTLVNLHEKDSRLRDIHNKMEPKAQGKIKDDRVFRREDLAQGRRRLLHEGTVSWKAASGRLKDILAVLLSDVEVAHEEKAMFLICASSSEPEMYEIHTTSKEERNTWMTQIRQAVER